MINTLYGSFRKLRIFLKQAIAPNLDKVKGLLVLAVQERTFYSVNEYQLFFFDESTHFNIHLLHVYVRKNQYSFINSFIH